MERAGGHARTWFEVAKNERGRNEDLAMQLGEPRLLYKVVSGRTKLAT
jgi:hypothetical protein